MTPNSWDAYDAYLFDIDGTLLNCTDAVHYFAFCDALTHVAGRPLNLDGVETHGSVDVAILRDAFTLAGVPESEWRPRLAEARTLMCEQVARNCADLRTDVLPGVPEILQYLRSQGKILGVATGNLAGIGRTKLAHAGLLEFFDFGGYSDAFETRSDVFAAAVEQARALTHPNANICVLGDTPADIKAAQANNLNVIAVATGTFPYETLSALNPTRTLQNLTELLPETTRNPEPHEVVAARN
jgi:phosphoglycolate phosphatase-like HAD superfamily hydrolase